MSCYSPFKTVRLRYLYHPAGQVNSESVTPQLVERDPLLAAAGQVPQVLPPPVGINFKGEYPEIFFYI